ncbi:MAG: methylthioribose kinase [Bacillaceae bacterium]|nr:methylthioribose kinase [Bacillaceae bacterium]
MIQRFIELGEGYSDIYELLLIGNTMKDRVEHCLAFHTIKNDEPRTSVAIVMKPTDPGDFQPIYICLEGIPYAKEKESKRYEMFKQLAEELGKPVIDLNVKPSVYFSEKELFYQHLIGILRMNHFIPPLN